MKAQIYNFLLLCVMMPSLLMANGDQDKGKITKEKRINKSYLVNANAGIDITNRYGNVYVTTWNEDKVAVDVVITVSGNSEEQVNKRLSSIDVEFEALKHLVTARTTIGNFSGGKTNMQINYTIKLPVKGSVILDNQYGNTKVSKVNGKANIECKYGELAIEELNGDSKIDIEYCGNATVGYLKNGSITAGYSTFSLTKAIKLVANCEYTPVNIGDIDDLTYNSEYGNLTIGNVDKITGTSEYTSIKVGSVNSLLNITADYGSIQVANLTKNVKNVAINAQYTGINIKYSDDYAFDFEIFTEYNKLNGGTDLKFQEKREKPTEAYYKGYHKSSGVNRLFIKSEYGNVNLKQL